jgi:hypothetical protein
MPSKIQPPAAHPCGSCPYRRDVPSGIWAWEEYAKLPLYDRPTVEQPLNVFLCHQNTDSLCAGWCGCHDMAESYSLRYWAALGRLEDPESVYGYTTTTPLFATGMAAALHGMKAIRRPGPKAKRTMHQLAAKKARRG